MSEMLNFLQNLKGGRNVVFYESYTRKGICTCGHTADRLMGLRCPSCSESSSVNFKRTKSGISNVTGLVYFKAEEVTEKSFVIRRYDLVYQVDAKNGMVTPIVREHGFLDYNYDNEKVVYQTSRGKKKQNAKEMLTGTRRSFTSLHEKDALAGLLRCEYFMRKTGFKEFLKSKGYKITAAPEKNYWGIEKVLEYIDYYYNEGNKGIEILLKAGFKKIPNEAFMGQIPLSGRSVRDIIKLPKSIIEVVKEKTSLRAVRLLEEIYQTDPGFTADHLNYLINEGDISWDRQHYYIDELLEKTLGLMKNGYKMKDLKEYLERADLYQAISQKETIMFLCDYVNMSIQMEVPYEKYPNSLKKSHDLAMREFHYVEDEIHEKILRKMVEENKALTYKSKDFCIVLPNDSGELVREGKRLRHCVASYIKKIVQGKSFIVFLRKLREPDKPYYTIEICNGGVAQIRGFANKGLNELKAKDFIVKWAKENNLYLRRS